MYTSALLLLYSKPLLIELHMWEINFLAISLPICFLPDPLQRNFPNETVLPFVLNRELSITPTCVCMCPPSVQMSGNILGSYSKRRIQKSPEVREIVVGSVETLLILILQQD